MVLPGNDGELPAALRADVAAAYRVPLAESMKIVALGDECDIWRLDTPRGRLAIRVSPRWRSQAELSRCHSLLAFVATRVPEAVAPLVTVHGTTTIEWEGRPVSVFPWVEGEPLARERPHLRDAAARLLARLHKAMLVWPEAGVLSGQATPVTQPRHAELVAPDPDATLLEVYRSRDLVRGPIHGDYYPRNLICQEERIMGVIDWDDSHHDLLAQELAWAVWEFTQHESDVSLDLEAARRFLAAYGDEGGPVPRNEHRLLIALIRKRLREEISQALAAAARGEAIDDAYTNREIAAFQKLRELDLEW
jgi:Ser/Thr protein kinase RdoA (MazF antagonist)